MLPDSGTLTASFSKKVVMVTGAASGIGQALAEAFARKGAKVVGVDLTFSSSVSQRRNRNDDILWSLACDVTNPQQVQDTIHQVKQKWGRIDIYCSNAGIMLPTPAITNSNIPPNDAATRHSEEEWHKITQVNVQSHVIAARELLPDWERGQGGDAIFVVTASAAGLLTQIGDASYGVSKAAAISFAEHLAIHHPKLQVHCLCPQAVDTPLVEQVDKMQNSAMADGMLSPETVADCTLQTIYKDPKCFFIFPHVTVPEYVRRKAMDHCRWLKGMQRLRLRLQQSKL